MALLRNGKYFNPYTKKQDPTFEDYMSDAADVLRKGYKPIGEFASTLGEGITEGAGKLGGLFSRGYQGLDKSLEEGLSTEEGRDKFDVALGSIGDILKRREAGELQAIDALASPYSGQRVAGAFEKGVGGADPLVDIQDARLLALKRTEDKREAKAKEDVREKNMQLLDALIKRYSK